MEILVLLRDYSLIIGFFSRLCLHIFVSPIMLESFDGLRGLKSLRDSLFVAQRSVPHCLKVN